MAASSGRLGFPGLSPGAGGGAREGGGEGIPWRPCWTDHGRTDPAPAG
ncbi:MAG: hypothetical protein AVDCRST_MAG08-2108 [uncultured Acetobacteraceae bacterium]|uniref:Uncharacterized protein n=1 Tax=uncultured Acetobacteraceae bacterium TaxID=169975 RepID=A0A6J4IJ32_9PROT|nr:MAG: hypothetical protein AVDCRST_MAG08-2108 [uncultured Acetobacteraceae bacterium]